MAETLASPRLWLAFATMLLVSGIGNTFPVFFPPLLEEFGGSRAATAFTVTCLWMGGAALGPIAGHLVTRWNPRLTVVLGLAAVALGLAVASLAPSLGVFVLAVGIGGGIGVGLTGMVTQAALIADEFVVRRGFATGIAFSGSMAGYLLAWPAQWAITNLGWRGALVCYVVGIATLVPCAVRAYPTRLRSSSGGAGDAAAGDGIGPIARSTPFWALLAVFTLPPLVGYLATTQHTLYLTARGFTATEASLLLSVGGVLSAGGRAVAGLVADRWGGPLTGFVSYSMSLVGVLCLVGMEASPARLLALGYVLFVFLPLGSRATIVAVLLGRIASRAQYAVAFGYLSVGNNLGAALGPLLSGALYDRTGSYLVIYVTAAALLVVGLAALAVFCRTTPARPGIP